MPTGRKSRRSFCTEILSLRNCEPIAAGKVTWNVRNGFHVKAINGFWSKQPPTKLDAGINVLGLARLDRVVKQQTIAAPHHPDAMLDQPARLVLTRVILKIFFRPAKAEQ